MGKAARWLRSLFGSKRDESPLQSPEPAAISGSKSAKKRWSFVKSHREKDRTTAGNTSDRRVPQRDALPAPPSRHVDAGVDDPKKREPAVAAAAPVRLTSSERCTGIPNTAAHDSTTARFGIREEELAVIKIQSHFRAYLSRRALRALKALVKLQALVRGHIVRKQTSDMLRRMQALLRAQVRARAGRALASESPNSSSKSSLSLNPDPATPEKFEHAIRSKSIRHDQLVLKRNGSKSATKLGDDQETKQYGWNWLESRIDQISRDQGGSSMTIRRRLDETTDKILEMDSGRHFTPDRRNHLQSSHFASAADPNGHSRATSRDTTTHQTAQSPSSCEVQSLSFLHFPCDVEEIAFCTADNSPQYYSASSRGGGSSKRSPFTPTKSDGSRSYLSGYSDYPSYMACTESSRAKMRSLSAPKQRPQFESSNSTKRSSVHGLSESRSSNLRISALHASFTSKAYPGSGRLDRLGMPVKDYAYGYNANYWNRY